MFLGAIDESFSGAAVRKARKADVEINIEINIQLSIRALVQVMEGGG